MPNVKQYTAKRELKLDCGHTVKSGETYQVVSAFACEKDGRWPISILLSCFSLMARKREKKQSAAASAPQQPEQKSSNGDKTSS